MITIEVDLIGLLICIPMFFAFHLLFLSYKACISLDGDQNNSFAFINQVCLMMLVVFT
jgi:hypothetical protein